MARDFFFQNGCQSNVSFVQMAQNVFFLFVLQGPSPSYPALQLGGNCPIINQDTDQNVILQGHDLESQCHL